MNEIGSAGGILPKYRLEREQDCSISGQTKIFACNASKGFAQNVAAYLGLPLGASYVGRFSDGEIQMEINESVRGCDCYIIQSTSPPVNDNLMELLIMIDAMRRASAGNINAVIPYFGYARQDRKSRARDPISAKLVTNLLSTAGADRVLTMDIHCAQIQGFFDKPFDNLKSAPIMVDYYTEKFKDSLDDVCVLSPDLGSVGRARAFADRLYVPLAIMDKRRPKPNESEIMNVIGKVKGKRVIIADDVIDTGGTIVNASKKLIEEGATEVYVCCTHSILSKDAVELILRAPIKELVVLDTVPLPMEKRIDKIKILSACDTFAHAIYKIHKGLPVSLLY